MIRISPFIDPIDIFEKTGYRTSELSDDDLSLIGGVIKAYKPQKILELGVSGGGTTSFILSAIEECDYEATVYSVDISEKWHLNNAKRCGFQIEDALEKLGGIAKSKLLLGKPIPNIIENVMSDGKPIDLLVMDTTHYLPGEVLDFLVVFPFLNKKSIVIVDDLMFAHYGENSHAIATRSLYSSVVATRLYLNNPLTDKMCGFMINEETTKYLNNIISSLSIPWEYSLGEYKRGYIECIIKYYETNLANNIKEIIDICEYTLERNIKHEISSLVKKCSEEKRIYLYTVMEQEEKALNAFLEDRGVKIAGRVVSDDRLTLDEKNIIGFSALEHRNDYVLLLALHDGAVRKELRNKGIEYTDIPNFVFPFVKEYVEYLL